MTLVLFRILLFIYCKFATDEDGLVAEIREMLNDINNNGQKTGENTG